MQKNNALLEFNNKAQADEIVKRTKELYDECSKLSKDGKLNWFPRVKEWTETLPFNVESWARAKISPVCDFLGGIVSQEIIKFTGKFTYQPMALI